MINQNDADFKNQNRIVRAIQDLGLSQMLKSANIRKSSGSPALIVFQFLLMLVFRGKNLFQFLRSKKKELADCKNTYYRFLNETSYNWPKFLTLLATKVIGFFDSLTGPHRVKVLVLDDSIIKRNRSKAVELLARVFDHTDYKYYKGFTMLTLGWSDGYSFVPVGFNLLSSAKRENRYQEVFEDRDKRTNAYKVCRDSMLKKPEAAWNLIRRALDAGIQASYVLMDSWFTTEPMLRELKQIGIDAIGMVKQLKQRYFYKGRLYTLPQLEKFVQKWDTHDIFGSLHVKTMGGIYVKIVFIRNRNKKSECLYLLSTDQTLSDAEIVRIYGNRWSIECFFKVSKSLLKLGTEFQSRSYTAMVSHTTIVFTRFVILEYLRRNENDRRTCGEIFCLVYDEVQDIELSDALRSLLELFLEHIHSSVAHITDALKNQLTLWFASLPLFIQNFLGEFRLKSSCSC